MEHGAPGHHGQVVANLVDLDQENELEAAITPLQKMVAKSVLENNLQLLHAILNAAVSSYHVHLIIKHSSDIKL